MRSPAKVELLTPDAVDRVLEAARQEVERKAAQYGPDAMDVLHEVAKDAEAPAPARVAAAKELVAQVRPRPTAQALAPQGPTIQVIIHRLSTGERRELPIPVLGSVIDAIEAGISPLLDVGDLGSDD